MIGMHNWATAEPEAAKKPEVRLEQRVEEAPKAVPGPKAVPEVKETEVPAYTGPDRTNYTDARHTGGENKNIDKIVLHITDSEGKSAEHWFHDARSNVSAHYIIEKDGTIVQIVPEDKIANHCRGKNTGSIGIELED
jgi:N-acetyl-anhydromuramyl-L-alanine amidase AmpD